MVKSNQVICSYDRYSSYDGRLWERTLFDSETDGFLVTSLQRIADSQKSKNALEIFIKEQGMCKKLVSFGFQVEHLSEIPGASTPDIEIKKHGALVVINGRTAELKRLSSSNNIYNEGKDARFNKRADLVVYEFTVHAINIVRELKRLAAKGIHGYYYYSAETKYSIF